MSRDRLQALYQEAQARRAALGEPCGVTLETMLLVLEQRGTEEERYRALAEILGNPACREEFELLRALVRASHGRRPTGSFRVWRWAAGIVVLASLGWGARAAFGPTSPNRLRGVSTGVTLLAPEGAVERPARLVWRAVPEAFRYQVTLVDSTGELRFAAMTGDTTVALPDSITLAPGATYRWWVRASLPDGAVRRSSPAVFTPAR